jgi:hypothetical protein
VLLASILSGRRLLTVIRDGSHVRRFRPPSEWLLLSQTQSSRMHAPLAQLVEQLTLNQRVRGSKP